MTLGPKGMGLVTLDFGGLGTTVGDIRVTLVLRVLEGSTVGTSVLREANDSLCSPTDEQW